jgi:hypothetical protein
MYSCTCSAPPVVDISDPLSANVLKETLEKWGWVHVVSTYTDESSPLNALKDVKNMAVQLFTEPSHLPSSVTYRARTSESGSSSTQLAEPKQSLQVQRCCCSTEKTIVHLWCDALHSVAKRVNELLQIPENLLLQEQDCNCQNDSCNVDLLRVFYYDPVPDHQLGSSPHTDWGSWTVVWQDTVGGLQAYCKSCDTYVNVDTSDEVLQFVVHVGDVTSMSIGTASMRNADSAMSPQVIFPSPQHRVVSPNAQSRLSLVYFSYPPPGVSLDAIEARLPGVLHTEKNTCVDFTSYYILKNQTSGGGVSMSEEETYQSIRSTPLDQVFAHKWDQVQRK